MEMEGAVRNRIGDKKEMSVTNKDLLHRSIDQHCAVLKHYNLPRPSYAADATRRRALLDKRFSAVQLMKTYARHARIIFISFPPSFLPPPPPPLPSPFSHPLIPVQPCGGAAAAAGGIDDSHSRSLSANLVWKEKGKKRKERKGKRIGPGSSGRQKDDEYAM